VKTREIGVMNFNLKGGSRLGPTKLSIALCAEGSHRGADWHKGDQQKELVVKSLVPWNCRELRGFLK